MSLIGAKGSAHIDGLCKWGPSTLSKRTRVFRLGFRMNKVHVQAITAAGVSVFQNTVPADWSLRKDVWIEKTLAQLSNQINRCQV